MPVAHTTSMPAAMHSFYLRSLYMRNELARGELELALARISAAERPVADRGGRRANAARLVRAGATAVKLEGGRKRVEAVHAILDAEIPVMGHLGLTPQSVHQLGGYRVQGRSDEDAARIKSDALALQQAGAAQMVSHLAVQALHGECSAQAQLLT